jgi:ketosteroid isomerase-like protein
MSFTTNDEALVRRLAVSYARGVDRRDRALFLSAFHPDATLTVPSGQVLKGHDEIGKVTEAIARYDRTFHFLGQSAYEPPDEGLDLRGTARGEVYCIAHHWTAGRPKWTMYIRYQDVYLQNDAGWLISARRVVVDQEKKE